MDVRVWSGVCGVVCVEWCVCVCRREKSTSTEVKK